MKLREKFKKEKNLIYLLAILMYVIGVLLNVCGKYSEAVEVIAALFLLVSVGFNISLSIIWVCNNKSHLKGAIINLFLLIFSTAFIFLCDIWNLGPTFWITIFFALDVAIIFIYEVFKVGVVYYDIVSN